MSQPLPPQSAPTDVKPQPATHLLSLMDLSVSHLSHLVDRSIDFAANPREARDILAGKIVGIYFRVPSTRTRTSFSVGALKLGAQIVTYGSDDLQLVTGEPIEDTARVLSGYLDALVIRSNGTIAEMQAFASQDKMAIINAMSKNEHPTQAIGDLATIKEQCGRLHDIHVLYLGEGNNTAAALACAVAQTPGMKMTFVTPPGYGLPEPFIETIQALARQTNSTIEHHHRMDKLPSPVDAVYTTRWETMGAPHSDPNWREKFLPYRVSPAVMAAVSKPSGTLFLHDLPAVRGDDVAGEVLDGGQSVAWRQAQYKMFSAMAVLAWCIEDSGV